MNLFIKLLVVCSVCIVIIGIHPRRAESSNTRSGDETTTQTVPTPTPSATPTPCAVIYTTNLVGNPFAANSNFTVDVRMKDNVYGAVMSFAFRVYFNNNLLEFISPPQKLELNANVNNGPIKGVAPNNYVFVMSQPNARNT